MIARRPSTGSWAIGMTLEGRVEANEAVRLQIKGHSFTALQEPQTVYQAEMTWTSKIANLVRWRLGAILLAAILSLGFASSSRGQEPLNFAKPIGPSAELCLRVLTEAYQRIGITIRAADLPAERSLVESNKGSYDGEVTRVRGIENSYPNLIPVPVPLTRAEGLVFTKNIAIIVDGWESLKPYSIIIRRGLKFAEEGTRGMKVTLVNTYPECFKLVSMGRYDVTVCDRLAGYYFIRQHAYADLKVLEPALESFHLYHYLHKKNASLIPEISAALAQMQAEGRMKAIRAAYIEELLHP
jgi:polar amino acid transport system substrate-binding protein